MDDILGLVFPKGRHRTPHSPSQRTTVFSGPLLGFPVGLGKGKVQDEEASERMEHHTYVVVTPHDES